VSFAEVAFGAKHFKTSFGGLMPFVFAANRSPRHCLGLVFDSQYSIPGRDAVQRCER
jgi:hypothetical protein